MVEDRSTDEAPASWRAIAIALVPALGGAALAAAGHFRLALLGMPLAVLVAFGLRRSVSGIWPGSAMRRTGIDRRTVLTSLVATPVVLIAMATTGTVLARVLGWQPDLGPFAGLGRNPLALLGWLVLVWTAAAFGEEIVFRGIVFRNLAGLFARGGLRATAAHLVALLVSSAIFGLAHAYQGRAGMAATGVAGLLFGGVFLLRSPANLWLPILVHGLTDTVGFISLYLNLGPA